MWVSGRLWKCPGVVGSDIQHSTCSFVKVLIACDIQLTCCGILRGAGGIQLGCRGVEVLGGFSVAVEVLGGAVYSAWL